MRLTAFYQKFLRTCTCLQAPLLFLIRLWITHVFFASGLVKIEDFGNAVALFQDEYKVPVLPPELAAILSTCFELGCSVLLILGLATRLAAVPLLVMTAVIQFTYDQNIQHLYWALCLGVLLSFGAGAISFDRLIARRYAKPV